MQRGAQDYEYLWLLAQKSGGREQADAIVNSIVNDFVRVGADRASLGSPGHWKHNSEDWERARIRRVISLRDSTGSSRVAASPREHRLNNRSGMQIPRGNPHVT